MYNRNQKEMMYVGAPKGKKHRVFSQETMLFIRVYFFLTDAYYARKRDCVFVYSVVPKWYPPPDASHMNKPAHYVKK